MFRYFFYVFGKYKCLKDMFKLILYIINSMYNVIVVIDIIIVKRILICIFICGKKLDGVLFEYVIFFFIYVVIMGCMYNFGYGIINLFFCVLY